MQRQHAETDADTDARDPPLLGYEAADVPPDNGQTAKPSSAIRGAATAFSDVVSVSAARGVSIVLALVSVTIVTHMLRPGRYAILAYIAVISGLMFTTTASWTATAVARYGREELERDGSVRATSWGRILITTPLVCVAMAVIVLLKLVGVLRGDLTWGYVAIAVASGLVLIGGEHLLNLLESCGRMKLTAIALALQRVLSIVGLVVLIVVGVTGSPAAIALIWLGVGAMFDAILACTVWTIGIWPVTIDMQLLRRMVVFSIPMIAFAASQYVIQAVDVVILGAFKPSRDVGLYAIAYQGYGALQQIATTATIVLSPLFVSLKVAAKERVIEQYFDRIVPQVLFLTAVAAGLGAAWLSVIVPLVFGHPFAPAAKPIAILLVAWVLYGGASFVAPVLVLHERSGAMGAISSVAAVVNVTGDLLLVGVFGIGIVGPAIATAASLVVIAVGYFYVAADCVGRRRTFPVTMLAPALVGMGLALPFNGVLGVTFAVAGTLITGAVIFLWRRPFAAADVELIEKLDIPGPFKQLTVSVLERMG